MIKKYNKLVRDKIPAILKQKGKRPVTRVLDEKEYVDQLIEKLWEEIDEFDHDHSVEEMADILEVLMALSQAVGISQQELKLVRAKKATTRGSFKQRIFLEKVLG